MKLSPTYVGKSAKCFTSKVGGVLNDAAVLDPLFDLVESLGVDESISCIVNPPPRRAEGAGQPGTEVPPIDSTPSQARVSEVIISQRPGTDVRRKCSVVHGVSTNFIETTVLG